MDGESRAVVPRCCPALLSLLSLFYTMSYLLSNMATLYVAPPPSSPSPIACPTWASPQIITALQKHGVPVGASSDDVQLSEE